MKQYTESKTFKFTETQMDSFRKLEVYGVNVSAFVRLAIAEKIKRRPQLRQNNPHIHPNKRQRNSQNKKPNNQHKKPIKPTST
jgi:hypothetical protein